MSLDKENIYYFNGTAYAGKSTMVKQLAEKYDGIACEENYHDELLETLDEGIRAVRIRPCHVPFRLYYE